jgi:hypothetical protein
MLKEQKAESQRNICSSMFIAALFMTVEIWKQPKCPGLISKQNVIYTYNRNCAAFKRKEILICAATWMNTEKIKLNEKS